MTANHQTRKSFFMTWKDFDKERFCECTEWTNGEGYDFNIDDKSIQLHHTELEAIIATSRMLCFRNDD